MRYKRKRAALLRNTAPIKSSSARQFKISSLSKQAPRWLADVLEELDLRGLNIVEDQGRIMLVQPDSGRFVTVTDLGRLGVCLGFSCGGGG